MNFSRMIEINLYKLQGYPSVEEQKGKLEKQLQELKEFVMKEAYEYILLWMKEEYKTAFELNKNFVILTWEQPITQNMNFYFTYHARISNKVSLESSFFKVIEIEDLLEKGGFYEQRAD